MSFMFFWVYVNVRPCPWQQQSGFGFGGSPKLFFYCQDQIEQDTYVGRDGALHPARVVEAVARVDPRPAEHPLGALLQVRSGLVVRA